MSLAIPITLAAILMVLYAVARWHAGTDASRYAELLNDRAASGASGAEIDQEMTLRMAAGDFRHKASMAVIAEPVRHEEIIVEAAKAEAMLLAATDKSTAKMFLTWVEGAGLDELLHPAARQAVWKAVKVGDLSPGSRALSAALRVQ